MGLTFDERHFLEGELIAQQKIADQAGEARMRLAYHADLRGDMIHHPAEVEFRRLAQIKCGLDDDRFPENLRWEFDRWLKSDSLTGPNGLIAQAGRALFGDRWQMDLSMALGIRDGGRSMRRWYSGEASPRDPEFREKLLQLMRRKSEPIERVIEKLSAE